MLAIEQGLVNKLKNHSKIGIRRNIYKRKAKSIVQKRENLNIQILGFHSSIVDKYKILGNFFLEQNFKFLQFISPEKSKELLFGRNVKTKYITKHKIKKVVETIYKDKQKLVEDFRLKELIEQRAQLIYNEQKSNDTKQIKEVLVKELNRFSRDITSSELDDRIVLYTKLNNYLNTININHKNIEYKIDKNIYLNYSSKEIKNIIKNFESIENIDYKKVDEYILNIQNVIKNIGITTKIEQKLIDKKYINKILNIKNITSVNEIMPIFTNVYENKISNISEDILKVLNSKSTIINNEQIINITQDITQTIETQLKAVFKNIVINNEYKNILIEDIKTIFLNTSYTKELKLQEINTTINNYINNIVIENQNKQIFKVENKKVIEEKVYEQSVNRLTKLGIHLHFSIKNELKSIIKNYISKTTNINTTEKFNIMVNDVIEHFLTTQKSIVNNSSILKKYTTTKNNIVENKTDSITVKHISSNMEQKFESIYKNIEKEIKSTQTLQQIDEVKKIQILQNIQNVVNLGDLSELQNIVQEFTQNIEIKDTPTQNIQNDIIQNISKQELIVEKLYENIVNKSIKNINKNEIVKKLTQIIKLNNIKQIDKEYLTFLKEYSTIEISQIENIIQNSVQENISNQKLVVESLYENIVNRSIKNINKNEVVKELTQIVNLNNIQEIQKQYSNIVNEYIDNTNTIQQNIEKIVEQNIVAKELNVENIYKNVLNQITKNSSNKYINIINKNELLKKITKLTKLSNITQINKEYQNLINEHKVEILSIRNIKNDIWSLTKLGDNVSISNTIEQKVEALYENILKDIRAKEPLKKISETQKQSILKDINKIIKLDSIEQINKEYKTILNQFVKNIEYTSIINKEVQADRIYQNVINEIKKVEPLKQITVKQKSQLLQSIQKIVNLDSIEKINIEYNKIVNEFVSKIQVENITNELSVDNIYKNVVNEITKNSTSKYINIINKKELINKITKISKLSNITVIDKEYKKLVNEYKIDYTNKLDVTSLGDNISITNNYEQRIESVYQNILKEIKVKHPHKQINTTQKSVLLQKIDKLIKLNDKDQVNRQYKELVEEFVYQNKSKESTRQSIIKKLIDNTTNSYVRNETNVILENTQKTLIKNLHKAKADDQNLDDGFVYISANEIKKKKEQEKKVELRSIDNKINEKEFQFNTNVQNIYQQFDENLDELALKIFRDIKDELSMEYKRI